jgi:hypothetical protein
MCIQFQERRPAIFRASLTPILAQSANCTSKTRNARVGNRGNRGQYDHEKHETCGPPHVPEKKRQAWAATSLTLGGAGGMVRSKCKE